MCTALGISDRLYGRTYDYERSFGEKVISTPRECVEFGVAKNRYAMLGIGVESECGPLYFDGVNEWGLWVSALNFPGFADYPPAKGDGAEIFSGSVVGFLLGFCRDTSEVKDALRKVKIVGEGKGISSAPLHWMIADERSALTLECTENGMKRYDNTVSLLTNSPEFPCQLLRLADYASLSCANPKERLDSLGISAYSRGLGAIGLPGDYSSSSRFARAFFVKENTRPFESDEPRADGSRREVGDSLPKSEVDRFFRIAASLEIPNGCVITDEGRPVATRYTCCVDLEFPTIYFTSYENKQVRSVKLTEDLMESKSLKTFPLYEKESIRSLN